MSCMPTTHTEQQTSCDIEHAHMLNSDGRSYCIHAKLMFGGHIASKFCTNFTLKTEVSRLHCCVQVTLSIVILTQNKLHRRGNQVNMDAININSMHIIHSQLILVISCIYNNIISLGLSFVYVFC